MESTRERKVEMAIFGTLVSDFLLDLSEVGLENTEIKLFFSQVLELFLSPMIYKIFFSSSMLKSQDCYFSP